MIILDYNHCTAACNCGWDLQITGTSEEELALIKSMLRPLIEDDETQYVSKAGTEPFRGNIGA